LQDYFDFQQTNNEGILSKKPQDTQNIALRQEEEVIIESA
jgi:hypothetical protein